MSVLRSLPGRLRLEPFVLAILAAVAVAAVLPVDGRAADVLGRVSTVSIGVLFFLYGTRLEPREALAGLTHWRLHLLVFGFTFVVFPLLGMGLRAVLAPVVGDDLADGLLYLTLVPSTVQSSITFVSIARGNVAAAVVSASVSNLLGVALTPLLVVVLMTSGGVRITGSSVVSLVVQLLLPFLLGQVLRRWVEPLLRGVPRLALFDKATIVLVVYLAFSEGMTEGIWSQVGWGQFGLVAVACCVLLGVVLTLTAGVARMTGLGTEDERVVQFCGSKKSLATGLPMAAVLFAGHPVGLLVLPLMVFHQIQLIVCSGLAARYGRLAEAP